MKDQLRSRMGWGGTNLQWHPQLGPINPAADQPAPRGPRSIAAPNPRVRRNMIVFRASRITQSKQGAPRRQPYRKTVGKSIKFVYPDRGARSA